jgi:hypothetical protein
VADRDGPVAGQAVALRWVSRLDPGNLLYGTIVATAALAVGASRGETTADMTEAMATTLIVYWLAHIYIATVRERPPGSATPLHRMVWHSAKNESAILAGGMPVVVVAAGLAAVGVSLWLSVLLDLGAATVVLVVLGLLAGLRAGVHGWRLGGEAAAAAVLGGILAALLVSLHGH